jgi:SulP family sulfate permease
VPLLPAAFTVAMLAAIESLLSAVVADGMSGDRQNSNVELLAQGVANLVVPFVGGIPATGAIARTATNIKSVARTPVSGMVHALTLIVILLVAAPLARFIPLATLAAILFVVAYNMSEWREVRTILRLSKADVTVWVMTFALTVLADLTIAVEIGMLFAALLYIYRVSQTTTVAPVTEEYIEDGRSHVLQDKLLPPYVLVLRSRNRPCDHASLPLNLRKDIRRILLGASGALTRTTMPRAREQRVPVYLSIHLSSG